MKDIQWGILGCGGIANTFATSLQALETGNLLAGASRSPGRAQAFADKHGMERVYTDYESLVSNPDINAIYIATTHNFHFENAKLCLNHNKHILCEKPFTVNATQMKELINLAQEKGLFMMEAFWTRFLPAIGKIKELLDEGAIGKVTTVYADFSVNPECDNTHRLKNKALAGGALLDLGVYPINMAAIVFGVHPSNIDSSVIMGETGVDYSHSLRFEYPEGRRAFLTSSFVESGPSQATIQGSQGYIQTPPFFHGSTEFTLYPKGGEPQTFKFPCPHEQMFKYEIDHCMKTIAAGKQESDIMPLSETLAVLKIMDDLRSAWGLVYPGEE
jgi:predicted dehydrogenase